MTQRIRGVLAPVLTPFKGDLSPDRERFIAHCKWLLSQNCGLAVFGTNSEANSLAAEERSMLLDAGKRQWGSHLNIRYFPAGKTEKQQRWKAESSNVEKRETQCR